MNSKLISILTLVLISKLIECQDWCKLITSDGKYKGMGIYNRFYRNESRSFVMYTKEKEWVFSITGRNPGVVLNDMKIQMTANSIKDNPNPEAVIKFGFFINFQNSLAHTFDCYVKKGTNTKWILKCTRIGPEDSEIKLKIDFPDFKSFVTFKENPIEIYGSKGNKLLVINKSQKGQSISYDVYYENGIVGSIDTPLFINQMDDWLFRQIEAVLDFNYGGNTGYLVLFNINGRPKYCFTSYGKDISPECKSPEKMYTLFEDCFQSRLTPQRITTTSVTLRTSTESTWNRNILYVAVILIIAVIFLIIVVISGLYCVKKWHKKRPISEKTSSTPNTQKLTPVSSVKTTKSGKSSKTSEVLPPKPKTQSN